MTDTADESNSTAVLSDRRSRYLLYCLQLYATPMSLPDIAEQLTVWERGGRGDGFRQQRLRMYNALHHDHLPRLQEDDIVAYDPSTERVDLGSAAARYTPVLEEVFQSEIATLLEAERTAIRANGTH